MSSVIADFCYQGKKKGVHIKSSTTLDDLLRELCDRFDSLSDPDLIELTEVHLFGNNSRIGKDLDFDFAREFLFLESDQKARFMITLKSSPSPSPPPLPLPYSQRVHAVHAPPIISNEFRGLPHQNGHNGVIRHEASPYIPRASIPLRNELNGINGSDQKHDAVFKDQPKKMPLQRANDVIDDISEGSYNAEPSEVPWNEPDPLVILYVMYIMPHFRTLSESLRCDLNVTSYLQF